MFDIPSIKIGRVFGIPIEINASWLVIFALVTLSLSTTYYPSLPEAQGAPAFVHVILGLLTSALFFASVVAHELSHSLVARAEGGGVHKITLFLFGGVAQMDEEPRTPGKEFLMAAAGPGMSLVLSLLFFAVFAVATVRGLPWWFSAPLRYLAAINLALGIFNLLPGFPLDGGRVLRSILWAATGDLGKATRWASRSGQFIGWFMVAIAVNGVLGGRADLIWFGLVGWFIASLAGAAYRQQEVESKIGNVTVGDVMTPSPEYVDGALAIDQLVQRYFLGARHTRYPVIHEGAIVGLVTLANVKAVERADWPFVRTVDITDRNLDQLVVDRAVPARELFARLAGDRPGALLVVGEGRLVGIVTRADLLTLLSGTPA